MVKLNQTVDFYRPMNLLNQMVEHRYDEDAVFRALADPNRRAMIERLGRREHTVSELAEPLEMSLAGASKHVGVLEDAGIVERSKRGRERVCTLKPEALLVLRDWIATYARFWDARLDALDAAVKEETGDE